MSKVIELRNINKSYGEVVQQQVLFDLSLSFEKNSFNSIIGQSGSGKTTLLNIMGTLDKPNDGKVFINSKRTDQLTNSELNLIRNQDIGFIFQFHYLLPEYTIMENILLPYRIFHGNVTEAIREKACDLLEGVGIAKIANSYASQISSGESQRAAIARALINDPKLVLADEPTGNLDSDSTSKVYKLLSDLNSQFDTSFIVITHNMSVAEKTERIVELQDGRIVSDRLL